MANVFLLEDDPDQLAIRKVLLECSGHRVQSAASVAEAGDRAACCDVIVMDIVAGCEEWLAELPAAARVIVLSGRQALSPSLQARCSCLLRKPCRSRALLDAIARICSTRYGHPG